jgi:hypothetical protein
MGPIEELRQFVADHKITFPEQRNPNAVAVTLTGDELIFLAWLLRETELYCGSVFRKISEALSEHEQLQALYDRALSSTATH